MAAYQSRFFRERGGGEAPGGGSALPAGPGSTRYKSRFFQGGLQAGAEGASGLKPTRTNGRATTELWERTAPAARPIETASGTAWPDGPAQALATLRGPRELPSAGRTREEAFEPSGAAQDLPVVKRGSTFGARRWGAEQTRAAADSVKGELEGLEGQLARLDRFRDAAMDGTWSPDDTLLRSITGGKPLEEARAELQEQIGVKEQDYGRLANRYSVKADSEALGRLAEDRDLYEQYAAAREAEADLKRLPAVYSAAPALVTGEGMTAEEQRTLREKYGLPAAQVDLLGAVSADTKGLDVVTVRLREQVAGTRAALAEAGFDYDRLKAFEDMARDAAAYGGKQEETARFAREHPVAASAVSVLAAPAQGIDYLRMAVEGIGHSDPRDLSTYRAPNPYDMDITSFVNTVRGTVSQEIEERTDWEIFGQNVASFLYQTGMSVADSALQVGTLGPAATVFMGASAASGQALDIMRRGGTSDQAFWGGLAAGAAETFFEKFSVDQLLKAKNVTGIRSLLKETVKQMGVEASEETFTEIANILSDAAVMGGSSGFDRAMEDYRAQGLTEEQAKERAFLDCVAQVAWAGAGGALSGGLMGGAVNSANYVGSRTSGAGIDRGIDNAYQAMEEHGMFSPEARAAAGDVDGRMGFRPGTGGTAAYEAPAVQTDGQQKTASGGEAAYTPLEADAIRHEGKTFRNLIVGIDSSVSAFFDKWRFGRKGQPDAKLEKLYLGKMSAETRARVGDILGYEVGERDFIITNDGVKHIMDTHGDPEAEVRKGNVPLTTAIIDSLPDIVAHPDVVRPGSIEKSSPYRQGVIFEKTLPDGTAVYIQFDNSGRGTFEGRTIYVKTKESSTSGVDASMETHTSTSKTTEPELSSDTMIPQAGLGVKGKDARTGTEYAARTEAARALDRSRAPRMAATLGENGAKAFMSAYDGELDLETAFDGFTQVYNAAVEGRKPPEVSLPETMGMAARAAGENDALRAEQARYFGTRAGLVQDETFLAAKVDKKTARVLDAVGKAAGVEVRFVDKVVAKITGAEANASYRDGVITISRGASDPVRVAFTHEIVHRIREVSPQAYSTLARFVQDNLSRKSENMLLIARSGSYQSRDMSVLTEEMVADAFSYMLGDGKMLERFAAEHRTVAQKVLDAVQELLEKVRAALGKGGGQDTVRLSAEQRADFSDLEGRLEEMSRTLRGALKQMEGDTQARQAASAQKKTAREGGGARYSLNEDFPKRFDAWDGVSKATFRVGTTSNVLQSIGIKKAGIIWHGGKIAEILRKHDGMTRDIIKQVPEILEHPIVILKSRQSESRIAVFGELNDANGDPVTAIVELQPTTKGGELLNMNVIASAYGKGTNPAGFVENSDLLYLDPNRNRTESWMQSVGLQLPSDATAFGSIGRISYPDGKVKIDGVPYRQYMQSDGKSSLEIQKKSSVKGFTEQGGDEHTAVRYSLKEMDGRRMPVVANTTYGALAQKPDNLKLMERAKAGDAEAARRLLVRVLKTDFFAQTARFFKGAELVPVRYREGGNALPLTLARMTAERARNKVFAGVYQMEHSGMKDHGDTWGRLMAPVRFTFDGEAPDLSGRRFVLVDDVVSSGSTLMALTHALEAAGGQVEGYLALARGRYVADDMAMTPGIRQAIEARLGREAVEAVLAWRLGYKVKLEDLTDKQGRAILAHQEEIRALRADGVDSRAGGPYDGAKEADIYGRGTEQKGADGIQGVLGEIVRGEDRGPEAVDAGVPRGGDAADGGVQKAQGRGRGTGARLPGWAEGHVVDKVSNPGSASARDITQGYISEVAVISDAALKSRSKGAWALTSEGTVLFSDAIPEELAAPIGYHEVIHAVRQRGNKAYRTFLSRLDDRIDFSSKQAVFVLDTVVKSRFPRKDLLELNDVELKTVYDELNALVWGYHKADPEHARKQFSEVFTDYDAYIAELDGIMEGVKGTADLARRVKGAETAGAAAGQEAEARRLWEELGTQSPYFKRFYDGNAPQLYEADGTPKVVYHGTAEPIQIFDKAKRGSFTRVKDATMGFFFTSSEKVAKGYAENTFPTEILKLRDEFDRMETLLGVVPEADALFKKMREKYEQAVRNYRSSGVSGALMRVYISMKDPAVEDFKGAPYQGNSGRYTRIIREALEAGKDGVIFQNVYDTFGSEKFREVSDVFVVFEPEQIKSATDNAGTFDPADPDVRHSLKGSREMDAAVRELMERAEREAGWTEAEFRREVDKIARKIYGEQIGQVKEQARSKEDAGRERRNAAELRGKIQRHTAELSKKLLRPSDQQHIPEALRGSVAAMLESINQESDPSARSFTVDKATGKRVYAPAGTPTKRTEAFLALKEQYAKIAAENRDMVIDPSLLGSDTEGIRGSFDEVIAMRDTRLGDMSVDQLETVWRVVKAVERSVTTAGKILSKTKYTRTKEWADAVMQDTAGRLDKRSLTKEHALIGLENPYTFFSHYGKAGHAIFRMLRDAQDQQQLMVDRVAEETRKVVDPKTVKALEETTRTFSTERGERLTLSTAQVMELYELMKRKQAHDHLIKGGIVQPEVKSAHIRRGTKSIRLTVGDLAVITGMLTDEQVQIADGLQKLTTGMLADYGNEASMAAYGYRKFTAADYWPIRSAREGVHSNIEQGGNNTRSIKNIGMAKTTMPHASNPLDIAGLFATFADHASDMTDYAAWLCAMEDANRLFNFQFRDGEGNLTGIAVKGILDRVGGPGSQKYWHNLMENIQNGIAAPADDPMTNLVSKSIGSFKGAAVGGNLRVVIQQPTAFFRAAVVLSPADLSRGLTGGVTKGSGWKKALQYSPIAMRKDTGSFDISSPRQMREILFDDRTRVRKLNDALSAPAGMADAITWGRLWNACEWATVREHKDLAKGSEKFYRAVNVLFTEVIDQTQVVDGVLQRANIMRSRNALSQQATTFMGEPVMSLNLMLRTYDQLRYEQDPGQRGRAIKTLGRAATALVVTNVVNALAQSLIDALRDDEEDKKYWERFWSAFTGLTGEEESAWDMAVATVLDGNAGSSLNPIGQIPFVKDVLSLAQGYDVSRTDMEVFSDLVRAAQTAMDSADGGGKKTRAYAVKELLAAGAKVFGIPVGNLARDMWGISRSITVETDNIPLQYEMEKAIFNITNEGNKGRYYDILFRALAQGDMDSYQHIRDDLMDHMGLDGVKIDSAMRSRYKKALEDDPGFSLGQEARDLIAVREQYAAAAEPEESLGADDLGKDAYRVYSTQRAEDYREMADALDDSPIFQGMDDETKDKVMKAAYSLADESALEDASDGQYKVTTKWMTMADDAERKGIEPWEYVLFHVAYEMAETERGWDKKPIEGREKSDKVRDWLEGFRGLTEREREFLWGTVYKSEW